jgi:hypothetical protein
MNKRTALEFIPGLVKRRAPSGILKDPGQIF